MVSINTNLQSLIVQQNLTKSTNALNQAIERMTTGFKLNHASDNAANYSISQDMVSKLSSYDIATDNISSGSDLVSTAQDSISLMQSHAERIHNLITQAMNGTYGKDSQKAIVNEINARIAEIDRLYATTEYNDISLFNNQKIDLAESSAPTQGDGGFLDESALSGPVMVEETGFIRALSTGMVDGVKDSYTDDEIAAMTKVRNLTEFTSGQTYAVTNKEDLLKLAELQNAGKSTSGVTFVLGDDIDLSGIDWNPIGDNSTNSNATRFRGIFNGNGHTISNLTINNPEAAYQGLFGYVNGGKIRNLDLENANISGKIYVGALAGCVNNGYIDNCHTKSDINGSGTYTGGLIGYCNKTTVSNCYSESTVSGTADTVGGLIGYCNTTTVSNCYSESTVSGGKSYVGGLIGHCYKNVTVLNCYSESNVNGSGIVGGFVGGLMEGSSISNSYSISTVNAEKSMAGGFVGWSRNSNISSCYSDSNVNAATSSSGGFIGLSTGNTNIHTCHVSGSVSGTNFIGGFIGAAGAGDTLSGTTTITNSSSYCTNVLGEEAVGSFIGGYRTQSFYPDDFKSSHGTEFIYNGGLSISNCNSVNLENKGMIGEASIFRFIDEGYPDPETGEWVSAKSSVKVKDESCDLTPLLEQINGIDIVTKPTSLQVGINGDDSSSISFDTNFMYDLRGITAGGKVGSNAYMIINNFIDKLSAKSTSLGAVSNRLDSAFESASVAMDNLTSSLSTIRDTDIAKESSAYIKSQILQQASATLLATANQSPSIALQLI